MPFRDRIAYMRLLQRRSSKLRASKPLLITSRTYSRGISHDIMCESQSCTTVKHSYTSETKAYIRQVNYTLPLYKTSDLRYVVTMRNAVNYQAWSMLAVCALILVLHLQLHLLLASMYSDRELDAMLFSRLRYYVQFLTYASRFSFSASPLPSVNSDGQIQQSLYHYSHGLALEE
jgi:hypothetical protein